MSNYASDCIRTLDYLLRKHDTLLRNSIREIDTSQIPRAEDRPFCPPLTVEEHDRIFFLGQDKSISNTQLAKLTGRSTTSCCNIRRGKHTLYDPRRVGRAA